MSPLALRVTTAALLVPAVLAGLFLLPPLGWAIATLLVVLGAAHEWAKLAGFERRRWLLFVGGTFLIGFNLLLPSSGFRAGWPDGVVLAVCGVSALFWLFVALPWIVLRWPTRSQIVLAVIGWIVLIGVWVALVQLQARSPWLVLAAMAIVWIADTAAYFSGRAFGRHKLAPQVSPGKTWEGVIGGLAAVAVYALALVPLAPSAGYTGPVTAPAIAAWVALALVIAAVSIVGDLFESWLKRQAGVKDSGSLLPGHGGLLDRIDALLAAMPFAALGALVWLRA